VGNRTIFVRIRNANSSISIESRTHVDRRFSDHKDPGYYLLQWFTLYINVMLIHKFISEVKVTM